MKTTKIFFIFLIIISTTKVQAQNYQISFAGSGASTTLDNVQVQNLTKGTSLTLNGSDILNLTGTTGNKTVSDNLLRIYPNPMTTACNVEFEIQKAGLVSLDLFDITGRKVNSYQNSLEMGLHTLSINMLNNGVYTLTLTTQDGSVSSKIISNNKVIGTASINYIYNEEAPVTNNSTVITQTINFRSAQTIVDMPYSNGDRLLLKGMSGIYSTLISIIPVANSTQTFNFVAATDYDGNNYTTVTIGTQTWMVENLKTTKYNDGTSIPNVTSNSSWIGLSTGAYCDYNNSTANGTIYGHLYNWYAVNTGKLAPVGWHVPTDAEWTTLENYLIANGYNYDGTTTGNKIAKSLAAKTNWTTSAVTGAIGKDFSLNNSSGFSALPGASRNHLYGSYWNLGMEGFWWTATVQTPGIFPIYRILDYSNASMTIGAYEKTFGFSVRCIKD